MDKVTVIIPCTKNNDIDRVAYSVLNQNFQEIEIYVVSNFIMDKKIEGINYVVMPNLKTIPELINNSIQHIKTELACFVHPDDLILYDSIKNRLDKFKENPSLIGCWGLGIDTDIDFRVKSELETYLFNKNNNVYKGIRSLLSGEIKPAITALMIRTQVLDDLKFSINIKFNYSLDFMLKLITRYGESICYINQPLYISKYKESLIKDKKAGFFIRNLRENIEILDSFFDTEILADTDVKASIYKANYYNFLSLLAEYFPHNYWLRTYLLASYIQENIQMNNNIFDFLYLSLLLNSLAAVKSVTGAGKTSSFNKAYT